MSQSREGQVFSAEMAGHETWLKEKKKCCFSSYWKAFAPPSNLASVLLQ